MKRRLVKHGPSSFIVTLPLTWIKYNKLDKGDEVNVLEENNKIVISSDFNNKEFHSKVEIHLHKKKDIIERIINTLYEKGIDEVRIYYEEPSDFQHILKALDCTETGYEIIDTRNKTCTLRNITRMSEEFDPIFRRSFLVALTLTEGISEIINKQDISELENLISLAKSNRKLILFCKRFVNKHSFEEKERIGPTYLVLSIISNIVGIFKQLAANMKALNPTRKKLKIHKDIREYYVQLAKSFRITYESYYSFDLDKIVQIKQINTELHKSLGDLANKLSEAQDIFLYNHATMLNSMMFTLIDNVILLGTEVKYDDL